ncbi:hypothetical protein XHV734_4583 [Xanthomonas hortorum pv. vitians]|nr:hypothetical protein XHV734_4583 [Xanthomonas hortorum pv. vitians]
MAAGAHRCVGLSGHLAGGVGGGGDQSIARCQDRCTDGAHLLAPAGSGQGAAVAGAAVRQRADRDFHDHSGGLGECHHGGADLRFADRLRGDLHRVPEAGDFAEHRDRRAGRCHAADAGLGGSDGLAYQRRLDQCLAAGADHLHLDAAAFLGAGDLPSRRLRQGRDPDVAGDPRRAAYAQADPGVHGAAGDRDPAAGGGGHERGVLSRRRAGAQRGVSLVRLAHARPAGRTVLDEDVRLLHRVSDGAVRVPDGGSLAAAVGALAAATGS